MAGDYIIKKGDTLSVIAQSTGTTVEQLKALNGLSSDTIKAGDTLITKVDINIDGTNGKSWEGDTVESFGRISSPVVPTVPTVPPVNTTLAPTPAQTREQKLLNVIDSKLNIPIYTTSIIERDGQKFLRISRENKPENDYNALKRDERCIGNIKYRLRVPDGIIQQYNDMGDVTGAGKSWKDSNTINIDKYLDVPLSAIGSEKYILFGKTNEELRKAVEEYNKGDENVLNSEVKTKNSVSQTKAPVTAQANDIKDAKNIQQTKQTQAKPTSQQTQDSKYYTVKSGDRFSKIAKKLGVNEELLQKVNFIKDRNDIKVGQKLYIPENLTKDQIKDKIKAKAKELGIPESLALAIADHESGGFNPYVTSSTGAVGLFQLTDKGAVAQLKKEGLTDCEKTYDIDKNIDYGIRYFKWCVDNTSTTEEALVAYNAGIGKLHEAQNTGKPIDSVTNQKNGKGYAANVLELQKKYQTE